MLVYISALTQKAARKNQTTDLVPSEKVNTAESALNNLLDVQNDLFRPLDTKQLKGLN